MYATASMGTIAALESMDAMNDLWPSFAELPMEIILHIFGYLNHADLVVAGATCSRWREALYYPQLNHSTLVRFSKECISDRLPPATYFQKSERPLRYFYMEEVNFGQMQMTMDNIGKTATHLTFDNVDISDKQFYLIMRRLPHLRQLTVTGCSQLFMPGSFLDNNHDSLINDAGVTLMTNLRQLSLRHNQYLSDAILLRIAAIMPGIESFDLSGCYIAYHNALHRRFYPNDNGLAAPSDSILTFKFILRILELHRLELRELNLSQTLIGGPGLRALSELESGALNLLRLRLAQCRQLNLIGLRTFLPTQPQLVVLDLTEAVCVNDECLECVVSANPLLEELYIAGCSAISNRGANLLGALMHLRCLDISRCGDISTEGITLGIARTRNTVLRELYMTSLKVCDECIKTVACNLPELRVLNVSNCVNGVGDESMQSIIANLTWLRELSIEDCFRVTDTALTGINLTKLKLQSSSDSMQNFNPPPPSSLAERESLRGSISSLKISLRTKAEEDIVRDANRKNAMFAAYELNLIDERSFEGSNIRRLRGLTVLNLKGCNKITDVSLKYGIKFVELRRLLLSNCQQISYIGMETLVQNCPSIEELDLSDCYNINDKTIQSITERLRRLRVLHISGCAQLTEHSVDAILINCQSLQTLSIYRCRHMYANIEERLAEMCTLRNLNMDNGSSMDNAEIFRIKKGLDY